MNLDNEDYVSDQPAQEGTDPIDENTSFLTSFNDEELLHFISQLSQNRRSKEPQAVPECFLDELDEFSTATNNSEELPFPLGQPQSPPPQINQDISDLQNANVAPSSSQSERQVFHDYGAYFEAKANNQQKQDEEYLAWEKERHSADPLAAPVTTTIFAGLSIHVNGHTQPNIHTLHKLIILNGGKFIHHLSRKCDVTHVIAERLTPRKLKEFKNVKVVKPGWVLECLKRGKVVDWVDFAVGNKGGYGQGRLGFTRKEDDEEIENEEAVGLDDQEVEKNPPDHDDKEDFNIALDSKHPDFLKIFLQKSRLHHLSSWKADLRQEFLHKSHQQKPIKKFHNSKSFKIILHIDFDCFFARVSSFQHPEIDFNVTPTCVTHAQRDLANSTADVSSANYAARSHGVRNGMWVRSAVKLCPDLVCLGYDFTNYERISRLFYDVLLGIGADAVLPVSVDEALLDLSSMFNEHDDDWASQLEKFCWDLKKDVETRTKCVVSLGCSSNVLLAKLSLRGAKPNGVVCHFGDLDWIGPVDIGQLPGIGRSIEFKLGSYLANKGTIADAEANLKIADLRDLTKLELQDLLGLRNGSKLYQFVRGVDDSSIALSPQDMIQKSISIDINWGIRFDTIEQVDTFIYALTKELTTKLQKFDVVTEQVSLKILKRAEGEPVNPAKFLGCGKCDSFSKLSNLGIPTDNSRSLGNEVRSLYRFIGCEPKELRGIGVTLTKLVDKASVGKQQRLNFKKLAEVRRKIDEQQQDPEYVSVGAKQEAPQHIDQTQFDIPSEIDSSVLNELPSSIAKPIQNQRAKNAAPIESLPRQIDLNVLKELPPDIQEELKFELKRRNFTELDASSNSGSRSFLQPIFQGGNSPQKFIRILKRRSPSRKQSPKKNLGSPSRLGVGGLDAILNTPTKKRVVADISLGELNDDVLNELPSSLREDVRRDYEIHKKVKHSELRELGKKRINFVDPHCNEPLSLEEDFYTIMDPEFVKQETMFQKRGDLNDILQLLRDWTKYTSHKGPNSKDWDMFVKYMDDLKDSRRKRYFKSAIIQELEMLLELGGLCGKWIVLLREIIDGYHHYN